MTDDKGLGNGFITGPEYLALPKDPHPWVIRDVVPVGGLCNLYGKPKTGKSFAALGMAHAIASGQQQWLGFTVEKPGKVAYLQVDTPRSAWAGRLHTISQAGYDLGQVYFADSLTAPYPFNILLPEHYEWLKTKIEEIQPVCVFIDTLREIHGGDENDSTVMRNVVTNLVAACRPSAIVLISHTRKETQMSVEDLMGDARGSSYVAGRMDAVLKLSAKTLLYKGRSSGEGKLDVMQDADTGMIVRTGSKDYLNTLCLQVYRENADKGVSRREMGRLVIEAYAKSGGDTSPATVDRRLAAIAKDEESL